MASKGGKAATSETVPLVVDREQVVAAGIRDDEAVIGRSSTA